MAGLCSPGNSEVVQARDEHLRQARLRSQPRGCGFNRGRYVRLLPSQLRNGAATLPLGNCGQDVVRGRERVAIAAMQSVEGEIILRAGLSLIAGYLE